MTYVSAGIRVQQELIGIETMAVLWLVGAIYPIAIPGRRLHPRQITMPDLVRVLGELIRSTSSLPSLSKRQTSTFVAFSEKMAKFVPLPSHVAPRGCGLPSRMSTFMLLFICPQLHRGLGASASTILTLRSQALFPSYSFCRTTIEFSIPCT
jgi:hypothetical protein